MSNYDNQTKHYIAIRKRESIKIFFCILLFILGVVLIIVSVYMEKNEFFTPMKIAGFSIAGIGIMGTIGFSIPLWLMSSSSSNKHSIMKWTSDSSALLVYVPPAIRTSIYANNTSSIDRPLFSETITKPKWSEDSQIIELPPRYTDVYPYLPRNYSHKPTRL